MAIDAVPSIVTSTVNEAEDLPPEAGRCGAPPIMNHGDGPALSIVIPVFNEAECIPQLAGRVRRVMDELGMEVEVVFVDDHSTDDTSQLLKRLCSEDGRFRYIRLSCNSGSHIAVLAGLEHSRGACRVFMAADLQDPPELIARMLGLWKAGNDVVWAVREQRPGIGLLERVFSRLFYWLMNRFGEVNLPPNGADFALLDRRVAEALAACVGAHPNLMCELAKIGFRQASFPYAKQGRISGRSKWTFRRKLKMLVDTFVSFSYAPLRAMSYTGIAASLLGFLYASFVVAMRIVRGSPVEGWASLMVVVLILGGAQMLMLGVLGEYVWRTLDEARKRPRYFIEDTAGREIQPRAGAPPGEER